MRRLFVYIFICCILAGLAFVGYTFIANFTYTRHITLPPQLLASSSDGVASTSDSSTDTTNSVFGDMTSNPASSTVDTTSWKSYSNSGLGFSVRYPADFVVNTDTHGSLILFIPKANYFHWPLLDDVKVTITATSSCPLVVSGFPHPNTGSVAIGSYIFNYSEGGDAAAGNVYREQAYDLMNGAVCYHIDLFDHGSNGAGLYVSDQSLITQYDNQHQTDLNTVVSIFNGVVHSFHIVSP